MQNKQRLLDLKKIGKDDIKLMDPILRSTGVISNFSCFPQLYAFLVKPGRDLYLLTAQERKRLILFQERPVRTLRLPFCRFRDDDFLIAELKKIFQPEYITYNLLTAQNLPKAAVAFREELILNVATVAELKDRRLLSDYRRCAKKHPYIEYIYLDKRYKDEIFKFLDDWCRTAGRKLEENPRAENDKSFLNLFLGQSFVKGGMAVEKGKIVGIAFHTYHPCDPQNLAVKVILKNLRGYAKFGQWLTVQEARQLREEGYKEALMGGTEIESQAYFKEQFMLNGRKKIYFSYEVFRRPGLKLRRNFLRDIWA